MRMGSTLLRNILRLIGGEGRSAASFAQARRQPQHEASLLGSEDENRELVRMLAGLLGLVSLVFMALFVMIRF